LVWITRTIDVREKLKWLLVSGTATGVVLAPWVGYNLTRFEHPVFLSTGYEVTLLTASCDTTWYGQYTGYWSLFCGVRTPRKADQSQKAIVYRRAAFDYIGDNKGRIPVVVAARWGRITGLFRPAGFVRAPRGRVTVTAAPASECCPPHESAARGRARRRAGGRAAGAAPPATTHIPTAQRDRLRDHRARVPDPAPGVAAQSGAAHG